jgi:multidrug efflux pump subunit AcrA (membrane-fusion protein)
MRVQGTIEIEPAHVALVVPVDAVEPSPDGPYVMTKTWLGAERRAVEIGRRNGGSVEITSGLAEGDRVLVTP